MVLAEASCAVREVARGISRGAQDWIACCEVYRMGESEPVTCRFRVEDATPAFSVARSALHARQYTRDEAAGRCAPRCACQPSIKLLMLQSDSLLLQMESRGCSWPFIAKAPESPPIA